MTTNGTNLFMTQDGISMPRTNMSKEEVQENIVKIMDWIRGPGNKLLISQTRLPLSFEEADEIRKAHEQFEFKCMQALAMYARLRDPRELDFTTADGLDQMEQSVKTFMQNLQQRRNVVVTCYTFFRLVMELRELMSSTDQLAEMLEAANDIESAEHCLTRLNSTLKTLETKYGLLTRECERVRRLIDQIQVMQEVERVMDELREHLTATSEWLKLRALETKKTLQVLTCERDARQANAWLEEMGNRLVDTYHRDCVGKTPVESGDRLESHRKLQAKAAEAHEYCKQLAHALMLMYRAAGRNVNAIDRFTAETADLWQRLSHLIQETSERLEVADSFYRNVDILLSRVEQLLILISRDLDAGAPLKQVRTKYGRGRDELLGEFEETKNMGIALMERICISMETNAPIDGVESVERTNGVIKMKLYTLWLKIREFLFLLGQKLEITAWIERWEVIKIQIDRLYELMLRLEERWRMNEKLPCTLPDAEEALGEHRRAWTDVNRLADQVLRDLEPLVSPEAAGQAEAGRPEDAAVREAARDELDRLRARKGQWDANWNTHKDRLDHRHDLLVRLNDLEKEVDLRLELLTKCKERSLCEERPVREADSQVSHWLQDLPDLRRRVNEFFGDVRAAGGDDLQPAVKRLREKWDHYEHDMDLFRWLVEVAIEVLGYFARVHDALHRFRTRLPDCRTVGEIDAMLQELAALIAEGRQLVNPDQVLDASRKLYNSEEPVRPLLERLSAIFVEISTTVEEVTHYKETLSEEQITVVRTHKVRSAPPMAPPEVQLEVNEPKHGGDLELLVHCRGMRDRPNVSWFRNGRPWEPRIPWRESWDGSSQRVWRTNVGPTDAGRYAVVVEDDEGRRAEAAAEVRVLQPPAFSRHLEPRVDVQEGDPVLLQCQVTGEPEPRCEWFHDGQQIPSIRDDLLIDNGDGVCAIKIPRVLPRHAGRYECVARSRAGEAVATTVISVQDADQLDTESVASRVTLDSEPEEQKSVSEIADSFNRETYTVPVKAKVQKEVPSEHDSQHSSPVRRDIFASISKPTQRPKDEIPDDQKRPWTFQRDYYQSVQPRRPEKVVRPSLSEPLSPDAEFVEKESLRLSVTYDGLPPPDVLWYKDKLAVRENHRTKIRTSDTRSTLTIDDLQASDAGLYSAVIKNQMGSERTSTQVNIRRPGYAPTLIRQSTQEQSVCEGDSAMLEFIVSAEPEVKVTWYKTGRVIRPNDDFKYVNPEPGLYQLHIRQAYLEDSGKYRAVAENIHGSKEISFNFLVERVVEEELTADITTSQRAAKVPSPIPLSDGVPTPSPPTFREPLEDTQTCSVGDRIFLRCRLSGHPPPLVSWYKNDEKIDSTVDHQMSNFDEEYRLVIPEAKPSDSGEYKIVASNVMGNVESACDLKIVGHESDHMRTTLIFHNTVVKSPPEFTQLFRDEICKSGDTVVLQCQIIGLPAPTVWWSYNGDMLDESRCQYENRGETYSLVIPNVKPDDSGRYSVTAENSSGVATCSSLVIVEEHGKTGLSEAAKSIQVQPMSSIEKGSYSRSSSRPLSPLLSMPLPNHSQLSHLAPSVQIERVRTVEVSPGAGTRRTYGDFESTTRLLVERSESSGSLAGVILNKYPDLRRQLRPLSPGSIIVASQTTRQETSVSLSDTPRQPSWRSSREVEKTSSSPQKREPPAKDSSSIPRPTEKRITKIVREYEQSPPPKPAASPSRERKADSTDLGSPTSSVGRRQFGRLKPSGTSIPIRIIREYETKKETPKEESSLHTCVRTPADTSSSFPFTIKKTTTTTKKIAGSSQAGGRFSLVESSEYDSD